MDLHNPQHLYELWERQQWQSHAIDLSRDRDHWLALPAKSQATLLRALSSFFIGEERVATQFNGLMLSAADAQEHSYLATQQVDEARHMQFFDRFYREVVGLDSPLIAQRIDQVRGNLGDAFLTIFDERLTAVDRRLIEAPDDIEAKVDFVTIYHMVIEGMLGIAGQRGVAEHLERKGGILPGLAEGFAHIERDEHRHVAYGTWFLAQSAATDRRLAGRVGERLSEVVPIAVASLRRDVGSVRGDEVTGVALTALRRRLGLVGISLDLAQVAE